MTVLAVVLGLLVPIAALAGYLWGVHRERERHRLDERRIAEALVDRRPEEPRSNDRSYITPIRWLR